MDEDDLFGTSVIAAARIASKAAGGQMLWRTLYANSLPEKDSSSTTPVSMRYRVSTNPSGFATSVLPEHLFGTPVPGICVSA
ncbi:MAG: hypothetical protein KC470_04500, partial [Dehalococcoidia bacterium]|nr:hypothetical protein [Dehalococcoidia bacterium]